MNHRPHITDRLDTSQSDETATGASERLSAPIDWHEPEVLRRELITAGLEVLDRDGPAYHVSGLTYAQVFAHLQDEYGIRVTRGSVHGRIWPNQEAFRLDAVVAYHRRLQARHDMSLGNVEALIEEFEARPTHPDNADEFLDRLALTHRDYNEGAGFPPTLVIRALSLAGNPTERAVLSGMDQLRGSKGIARMAWLFRRALNAVGHRPRVALGLGDDASALMAVLASSTATGLMLNGSVGMPSTWGASSAADQSDPRSQRSLFRIALQAQFHLLFEPAPPGSEVPIGERPEWPGRNVEQEITAVDPSEFRPAKRRSRSELKQLILAAAVETMEQNGLSLTASSIGYRAVFDRIKEKHGVIVNRSSVHRRLWSSNDEFRNDVLDAAVAELPSAGFSDGLRETEIHIDDRGVVDSRRLTWDAIRLTVHRWWDNPRNKLALSRSNLLKAALLDTDPDQRLVELQRKLTQQHEAMLEVYRSTYEPRQRPLTSAVNSDIGDSWDEAFRIQSAGVFATLSGLYFDHQAGLEPPTRTYELTGVEGEPVQVWSTPALGALAYTNHLFRFVDRPFAELGVGRSDRQTRTD